MAKLTQARLMEVLNYDPKTGVFTWKKRKPSEWSSPAKGRTWNSRYAGQQAGVKTHGYIRLSVDDQKHYAHRLAFLYMTGSFPDELVDHINHNGEDNRWRNLRHANKALNAENTRRPRQNKTGFTGVVKLPSGRYMAQRKSKNSGRYLGSFDTPEEAHEAFLRSKNNP